MSIVRIPCAHNYYRNVRTLVTPAPFRGKRVDIVIRFRIFERFVFHLSDGQVIGTTPFTVNDGAATTCTVHPWCPHCKASVNSLYLSHQQPLEDCFDLFNFLCEKATDLVYGESNRRLPHLKYSHNVIFHVDHHRFQVDHVNYRHYEDEEEEEEEEMGLGYRLMPTIGEAIESLERITFTTSSEDQAIDNTCAICLEGLMNNNNNEDEQVGRRLPCKHEFHEDCILKWLHTSHYCPLCRFELPT